MRVLQLISTRGFYGAECMVLNLAKDLERAGCSTEIGIICDRANSTAGLASIAREAGLRVTAFLSERRNDWTILRQIREHVKRGTFDVVHTHGYKADFFGYSAARALGVPVAATAHNWTDRTLALRVYGFLDRCILRRFDRVAAVSDTVKTKLERAGLKAGKIQTVPNGVGTDSFQSIGPRPVHSALGQGEHVVGMAGRLVPQKGFQFMLQASPAILAVKPRTTFLIVGDGGHRAALEQLAAELGIQEHVRFAGHRADMPGIYKSMDVFVLPSLEEGMPMCVLEAMGAGVPVIATSIGGVPQVVRDGETGLLVNPGSVVELEHAVLRLLTDTGLRRRVALAGQNSVAAHFSSQKMARTYLEIYRALWPSVPGVEEIGRARASAAGL